MFAWFTDWFTDWLINWLIDCLYSQGNSMPEPKSMLEVTIEVNNLVSLASAKELYTASMESLCGGDRLSSSIYLSWLPQKHKCYQVTTPPGNPVPPSGVHHRDSMTCAMILLCPRGSSRSREAPTTVACILVKYNVSWNNVVPSFRLICMKP